MHHELKILPAYFEAVIDGRKTFEIRKDDRGFQSGDTVTLREYDPEYKGYYRHDDDKYTGRTHSATIGYVSAYEQQRGYVVFSLLHKAKPTGTECQGKEQER
jgi:hypothetical protein